MIARSRRDRSDPDKQVDEPAGAPSAPVNLAMVQRSAGNRAVTQLMRSSGEALSGSVRGDLEDAFQRSFADVRVHRDGFAEQRGALAVTQGRDIHLARSQAVDRPDGRMVLAHELAHVVQQQDLPSTTEPAARLADRGLERQAHRAAMLAVSGDGAASAGLSRVAAGTAVAQHFEESEHRDIGNEGAAGFAGPRMVELAPGYQVSFGEVVAMGADHFEGIDQIRAMAAIPGPGAGTREEVEYVRTVKVNGQKPPPTFSDAAMKAADQRYYRLAANNPAHFLAPNTGEGDRPIGDRAQDTEFAGISIASIFPLTVELVSAPRNAVAGYHHAHAKALVEAAQAGRAGAPVDAPMAAEAVSNHYLTDSFAGGHVRTERRSAFEFWNEKVPMFTFNLQGYLAERIAEELADSWWPGVLRSEEGFYHEGVPFFAEGTLPTIVRKFAEKGVALTFGHVVAGAIHDWDNENGVRATVGMEEVLLKGDSHLGQGDERRLAVAAVRASVAEVEAAYRLGQAGVAPDSLPAVIFGPSTDGLFAAERLLPRPVPDEEQFLRTDATMSVPWDFPGYQELLGNFRFAAALALFASKKAGELTGLVANEVEEARTAIGRIATRLRGGQAPAVLQEIIEWVPDTGGKLFGRLEDDNAMDYIEHAAAVSGGLGSLSVPARVKLIDFLFSGKTWSDEEDAAFRVLTADPAHVQQVIDRVGWDRLEDELGDRFSDAYPQR